MEDEISLVIQRFDIPRDGIQDPKSCRIHTQKTFYGFFEFLSFTT